MKQKKTAEFRFYEKPGGEPVLALTGKDWIRDFGGEIPCLHFHNLMEIGRCIQGRGKIVLGNEVYDYGEDMFTLIPQNILHGTSSEGDCYWEYLFFDMEELMEEFDHYDLKKANKIIRSVMGNGRIYQRNVRPDIWNLIEMIFELVRKKNDYYKETVKALLAGVVMQMAADNEIENKGQRNENVSSIAPALKYIEENYQQEIQIQNLAECCHVSEAHFRRIFQKNMNMTPVEYINLVRVQAACDLMRKNNYQMEEVAQKAGFQTVSTFNRNFNKIIGSTPYQWKKQMDKNTEKVNEYYIRARKGWQ